MVRKQLYITTQQELALKERAARLAMTEAAIVRAALDDVLGTSPEMTPGQAVALQAFLDESKRVRGKPPPNDESLFGRKPYDARPAYRRRFVFGKEKGA